MARERLAEQKAKRNAAIPAEEKENILADLNSDDKRVITRRMVMLKIMKPHPDDKDVALLIQKYIDDEHRPLRVMAQAAWGRWKVLVEPPTAESTGPTDASKGRAAAAERPAGRSTAPATGNPFALPSDPQGLRTWTDSTGEFTIEAEFVALTDGQVKLRRKDGKVLTLPLSRLSEQDQRAAKRLAPQGG